MIRDSSAAWIEADPRAGRSGPGRRWLVFLRSFSRSRSGVVGFALVIFVTTVSIMAPALAPYDPNKPQPSIRLDAPSAEHRFGTDSLGRDTFSRVLYGGRISLLVSASAVAVAAIWGATIGVIAGFFGRWIDLAIMRLMDAAMAIPGLILATVLAASLGPSIRNIVIAIGVAAIPGYTRLVRGEVLRVRERDYVLAARTLGATRTRLVLRHIVPNILAPILVVVTIGLSGAILTEASLGFLGLGVPPPTPTWGRSVQEGSPFLERAPWLSFSGGAIISITILGFSLLGDGLRDTLDPRLRNR